MQDYSHIVVSAVDSSELADMKLAYVTAAQERDALEEGNLQLRHSLVGIVMEFGCSSRIETAALVDRIDDLLEAEDYECWVLALG